MSSEKGLVITPTEQLPFKCASSVILFLVDFFSLKVPSFGGNFIRFFPLISSQSSLSLDVDIEREQRTMRKRDREDFSSSVRFLLFLFFLFERESERELKREKFESFFSPLKWVRSTETFVLSLVKRDKKNSLY